MAVQKEVFTFFPPDWILTTTLATNNPVVCTKAALSGKNHYVLHVTASCSAAAGAATTLIIADGGVTIYRVEWPTAQTYVDLNFEKRPLKISTNSALTVTLGALGSTTSGTVNVTGFTQLAP